MNNITSPFTVMMAAQHEPLKSTQCNFFHQGDLGGHTSAQADTNCYPPKWLKNIVSLPLTDPRRDLNTLSALSLTLWNTGICLRNWMTRDSRLVVPMNVACWKARALWSRSWTREIYWSQGKLLISLPVKGCWASWAWGLLAILTPCSILVSHN